MAGQIGSLILIGFSVFIFLLSLQYGIGNLGNPGPGFMPLLASILVFCLSLVVFLREKAQTNKNKEKIAAGEIARLFKPGLLFFSLFIYSYLLEPFGFLLTTFLLMYVMFSITEPRKWLTNLWIAVVITASSYILFRSFLQVLLPIGALKFGW